MSELNEGPDKFAAIYRVVSALVSEGLFVLLPLLVVALAALNRGLSGSDILASPDWSFAAVVFLGQSVVKLIRGVGVKRGARLRVEGAVLLASAVIVILLVPTLLVLAFLQSASAPAAWLVRAQLLLFSASLVAFSVIGGLAEAVVAGAVRRRPPNKEKHPASDVATPNAGGHGARG